MNTSRASSFGRALVLAILASVVIVIPIASQTQTSVPKWEVVSIKPCASVGAWAPVISTARVTLNCQTVIGFITTAYVIDADGRNQSIFSASKTPIEGGPAWIRSDFYTINAKAEGTPGSVMMQGRMLQALLEDRFKLKIHREARQVPVYNLSLAKGGPKFIPHKEGNCVVNDFTRDVFVPPPPLDPGQRRCTARGGQHGANIQIDAEGFTVQQFSDVFLNTLPSIDRPTIDRTGLTGLFDFHLEYYSIRPGIDPTLPPDPAAAPSIFTALQEQLGLKLEATKGPGDFLVIDSISRPTEN